VTNASVAAQAAVAHLARTYDPASTVVVMEDLDLSGVRGRRRFALRRVQRIVEKRFPHVEYIEPAYTSQVCLRHHAATQPPM